MAKIKKKDKEKDKKTLAKRSGIGGIQTVMGHIDRKYGKGLVRRYGDEDVKKVDVIPTGSIKLNRALIIGGVPRGRVVEVYGPEMGGKTTLVLQILANAQKAGGLVAFIDAEHALDPTLADGVGAVMDDLFLSQPDYGEQALEITEMLVRSSEFDVIAIDSVSALVPKAEIEGEIGDAHMGLQARMMGQALRKLTSIIHKSNTCVIFINQIRQKIGITFGNPEVTSGGKALKFFSSIRLDIRAIAQIKKGSGEDAAVIGNKVRIKVVKNKLAPPFRIAETELIFGRGFNIEGELLDLAVMHGIVEKSGSWYSYKDDKIGNGRTEVCQFLKDKSEVFDEIQADVEIAEASGESEWS